MTPQPVPIDPDLPELLRTLGCQHDRGDEPGCSTTLAALGRERCAQPLVRLAALAVGGFGAALRVALAADPGAGPDAALGRLIDDFTAVLDGPDGAGAAARMVETLALDTAASALPDLLRATILIERGPLAEVPQAVAAAMRLRRWALALQGLQRTRDELGSRTPRDTFGLAAMCLHHLGRYAEADRWMAEGLGPADAARLQLPPLHTEVELIRRWRGRTEPVVTILCTTYNHERYIDSAIRGFLSQDCSHPFEILIHDDASTDGTAAVIRRWQERYPRLIRPLLQTVNQKSRGVHPFELLLARARGTFVATCEGDDYWIAPRKLQHQVDFLIAHPECSCSAHNYLHVIESSLVVRTWSRLGRDVFLSQRQLMSTQFLLWLPTLVFRRSFQALPPERALAAFGDQFLTSWLGTLGRCAYFDSLVGAVRRENEFSTWSPLPEAEKERRRVKTWIAMLRLHERLGHAEAVDDLRRRIGASKLAGPVKAALLEATAPAAQPSLAPA